MRREILTAKNVVVQGITGTHGAFHAASMRAGGTLVVAGTSPNKAGQMVNGVPVYANIESIKKDYRVDISVIFVPAPYAKGAMLEAIEANIPLIICITEGVPVHDMLEVKRCAQQTNVTIIGPNCPGVLLPGDNKLGIIPANMGLPGSIGIVSRSGTLTYETAAGLSARGLGQRYIIGIGGDRIQGTGFIDCLQLFEEDPEVTSIVLIGEIGGTGEQKAADYIQSSVTKPVYAYIAGHTAPLGVQLGHAGAILGSLDESAAAKTKALSAAGVHTYSSIVELVAAINNKHSLVSIEGACAYGATLLERAWQSIDNHSTSTYNVHMPTINTNLTTSGNSVAVRLPKELLRMSGLGSKVKLEARQGKIIISKVSESRSDWSTQIKALSEKENAAAEFTDMNMTALDGLEDLPWDGPSFEQWQKK